MHNDKRTKADYFSFGLTQLISTFICNHCPLERYKVENLKNSALCCLNDESPLGVLMTPGGSMMTLHLVVMNETIHVVRASSDVVHCQWNDGLWSQGDQCWGIYSHVNLQLSCMSLTHKPTILECKMLKVMMI